MSTATLTPKDTRILSHLFDPEAAQPTTTSSSATTTTTTPQQPLPHIPAHLLPTLLATEHRALTPLLTSPTPSTTDLTTAIAALSTLISTHPSYAPAYTNRAQALRLQLSPDADAGVVFKAENAAVAARIFEDLGTAIALLSGESGTGVPVVGGLHARTLAAAHAHRGYLFLRAAKGVREAEAEAEAEAGAETSANTAPAPSPTPSIAAVRGQSASALEERASRDFAAAGRLGDRVARGMAVRTNPYAKMCGAIVREAMREEVGEAASV